MSPSQWYWLFQQMGMPAGKQVQSPGGELPPFNIPPQVSPGNIPGYGGIYGPGETPPGPGGIPGFELPPDWEEQFGDLQNPNVPTITDPILQNFANQPPTGPPFDFRSPIYPDPWNFPNQGNSITDPYTGNPRLQIPEIGFKPNIYPYAPGTQGIPGEVPTTYDEFTSPGLSPIEPYRGITRFGEGTQIGYQPVMQPEPSPWAEPTAIPGAEEMPEPPPGVYGTELGANIPNLSDIIGGPNIPAGYGAGPGMEFGPPPASYGDFLQYQDYGGVGDIFNNPPNYVEAPPAETGVAAGGAPVNPYQFNLPGGTFALPDLWSAGSTVPTGMEFGTPAAAPPDVGSVVFGGQLDPNLAAAAYAPDAVPGNFLTQGFPDNIPTAPGVEPDVLPAEPLPSGPTIDPMTGQPYPQMPNIPINPATGLPWTAANIPGVNLTPGDRAQMILNQMRQPTNYQNLGNLTRPVTDFLSGIPGAIGDLINQPGYSSPAYLAAMGYQPGAGGTMWPGGAPSYAFGGRVNPAAANIPLPGATAGLGSFGGGSIANMGMGLGRGLLANWLRTGGRNTMSPSVPNPQAQALIINALQNNPVARQFGPVTRAQDVFLTPQLRGMVQNFLAGGRGRGAREGQTAVGVRGGGRATP